MLIMLGTVRYYFILHCPDTWIFTFSPTPPTAFFIPKSLRFMTVVELKSSNFGLFRLGLIVALKVTGLVTLRKVKLPEIRYLLLASGLNAILLKEAEGYLAA